MLIYDGPSETTVVEYTTNYDGHLQKTIVVLSSFYDGSSETTVVEYSKDYDGL